MLFLHIFPVPASTINALRFGRRSMQPLQNFLQNIAHVVVLKELEDQVIAAFRTAFPDIHWVGFEQYRAPVKPINLSKIR
jgi:hypothetical protein